MKVGRKNHAAIKNLIKQTNLKLKREEKERTFTHTIASKIKWLQLTTLTSLISSDSSELLPP